MIFNPIVVGGGAKLPELTTPGTAADLLASKQLIDADGNVLTGTMPTATQATPSISVSSAGLITASAAQTAGYVSAGTKSATKQLTTKTAATITPGTANQTIAAGRYLTGTQTIKGDGNLLAENIKSGVSIFGVAGDYEGQTVYTDLKTGSNATISFVANSPNISNTCICFTLDYTPVNGSILGLAFRLCHYPNSSSFVYLNGFYGVGVALATTHYPIYLDYYEKSSGSWTHGQMCLLDVAENRVYISYPTKAPSISAFTPFNDTGYGYRISYLV